MFKKTSISSLLLIMLLMCSGQIMAHSDHVEKPKAHQEPKKHLEHMKSESQEPKEHHEPMASESSEPKTLQDTINAIDKANTQLQDDLKKNRLDNVHDLTEEMNTELESVLTFTEDYKTSANIRISTSRIAKRLGLIHKYADKDDIDKTRYHFKKLKISLAYLFKQIRKPKMKENHEEASIERRIYRDC